MSISVPSKKCSDVLFGDNLPINMFIRNYSSLPDPQENQRFDDDIYTDKKLIIKVIVKIIRNFKLIRTYNFYNYVNLIKY